jgi:hypothetical protein
MMDWTRRQVLDLAPNNLISSRGKSLSSLRSWDTAATNDHLLWGKCKSSGERLYSIAVDLTNARFFCNCQSQNNPCRHVIGLLLLYIGQPASFHKEEHAPDWANELMLQPGSAVHSEEEKKRRAAQREQRFGKRLLEMEAGVDELDRWLIDLIRQGLSVMANYDSSFWEKAAARMQDAKLGGIARRIRRFYSLQQTEGWHVRMLEEIAQLYLFVQAFRQLEELPEPLQEEVMSMAGINKKREELLKAAGLTDRWLVVGMTEKEEDKLFSRKSYLLGAQTGRTALIIDFNYGQPKFEFSWPVGSVLEGEIIFYPGAFPLRALVKKTRAYRQALNIAGGFSKLEAFALAYAEALSVHPWLDAFPALLSEVRAVKNGQQIYLQDEEGKAIPLSVEHHSSWSLLALSMEQSLMIFGLWDGLFFNPVSVLGNNRVIPLQGKSIDFTDDESQEV